MRTTTAPSDRSFALRIAGALGVVLSVITACSSSSNDAVKLAELTGACVLNSDCTSPYVCAFQSCHVACNSSRDCQPIPDTRCVESDKPFHVCLNAKETSCVRNSDCPGAEICGVDLQCRDACVTDRDCLSDQTCVSGTCADPSDLVDGGLVTKDVDASDDACLHSSDCPGALVCIRGSCTIECSTAKDCPVSWSCYQTRCAPPGYGEGGIVDAGAIPDGASDSGDAGTESD